MIISLVWAIIDFSCWSGGALLVSFILTAYYGVKFAYSVKKDPKGYIDSFNLKGMIILVLVGLSVNCNGQNVNRYESAEFNVYSIKFIDLDDFICQVDSSMQYHFCDKQPLDNIFIGDDSVLELINNHSIDLFLEYKKECDKPTHAHYVIDCKLVYAKADETPRADTPVILSNKKPDFPDFLEWIEKRK